VGNTTKTRRGRGTEEEETAKQEEAEKDGGKGGQREQG